MQPIGLLVMLPLDTVLLLSGLYGAPHRLFLLVLGLQLPLQVEVELPLALDALLLHIADHALVHCLGRRDAIVSVLKRSKGGVDHAMAYSSSEVKGAARTYGFLGLLLEVHEDDGRRGEERCPGEGDFRAAGCHCG